MKSFFKLMLMSMVLLSGYIYGFDNKREGLFFGVGAGFTNADLKASNGFETVNLSGNGQALSLKVGYGINEQFAIYSAYNQSWLDVNVEGVNSNLWNGRIVLGAMYYLKPDPETLYLNVAFGKGMLENEDSDFTLGDGKAFLLGIGYELSPHFQVELNYINHTLDGCCLFEGIDYDTSSVQLTLNYLLY